MTIIQKILGMLKLPDDEQNSSNHKMEQYYKRERVKKEINLSITYQDIAEYDMKPFDLKQPLISDGNFVCIALNGYNLDKAYEYLHIANALIKPFYKYFKGVTLPNKIKTDYAYQRNIPVSHLRLTPYTSTKRKCKYTFCLWLQHFDNHGYLYTYILYFNQSGEFKKGDLSFNGEKATVSYQIQIRNDGTENYVRRIDKTLYKEPYGTHILYMYDE